MLRDQVRSYTPGSRMSGLMVLRPFASEGGTLSSLWRNRTAEEDLLERTTSTPSLSERIRGRGWNAISDKEVPRPAKVPGLVNTGNSCFMNSVLQVPNTPTPSTSLHPSLHIVQLPVTWTLLMLGPRLPARIPNLSRRNQRTRRIHTSSKHPLQPPPPPKHPPPLLHLPPPRHRLPRPPPIRQKPSPRNPRPTRRPRILRPPPRHTRTRSGPTMANRQQTRGPRINHLVTLPKPARGGNAGV